MALQDAYTRIGYINPNATTTSLFLRHRIGNDANRESWIYYYEPNNNDVVSLPRLPIRIERSGSGNRDYWYMNVETNRGRFQIADNFYCSFSRTDHNTNRCTVDMPAMKFRMYFYKSDGSPGSNGCTKSITS